MRRVLLVRVHTSDTFAAAFSARNEMKIGKFLPSFNSWQSTSTALTVWTAKHRVNPVYAIWCGFFRNSRIPTDYFPAYAISNDDRKETSFTHPLDWLLRE